MFSNVELEKKSIATIKNLEDMRYYEQGLNMNCSELAEMDTEYDYACKCIKNVPKLEKKMTDLKNKYVSESEKTSTLADFIVNSWHGCPFKDESGVDFDKECVGFRENGCKECLLRNIGKLN